MVKEQGFGFNALVVIFITVIVGVALLGALGDSTAELDDINTWNNESLDINASRTAGNTILEAAANYSLTYDAVSVSSVRIVNNTLLTEGTDYNVDLVNDEINFLNSSQMISTASNNTLVSYTSEAANYVGNSTARTLTNLTLIFFAIGILMALFVWVFRDEIKGYFGY